MWVIQERVDLAFSIKELARHVSKPTAQDVACLKRVLRYLAGTLDAEMVLRCGEEPVIECFVDASWASDPSMKSTSGGLLYYGGCLMCLWSRTQHVISQSSCEAELVAMNTGGCESMFLRTMLQELNQPAGTITPMTDSKSGKAATTRK